MDESLFAVCCVYLSVSPLQSISPQSEVPPTVNTGRDWDLVWHCRPLSTPQDTWLAAPGLHLTWPLLETTVVLACYLCIDRFYDRMFVF